VGLSTTTFLAISVATFSETFENASNASIVCSLQTKKAVLWQRNDTMLL